MGLGCGEEVGGAEATAIDLRVVMLGFSVQRQQANGRLAAAVPVDQM